MFTSVKNLLPSEFESVNIKNRTEKTFLLFPMVASEFLVCYLCYLSFIQEQDTGNSIIKLTAFINTFFFYHFCCFDLCVRHRQCSVQLQQLAGEVLRTFMECKAAKTPCHLSSALLFSQEIPPGLSDIIFHPRNYPNSFISARIFPDVL